MKIFELLQTTLARIEGINTRIFMANSTKHFGVVQKDIDGEYSRWIYFGGNEDEAVSAFVRSENGELLPLDKLK